MRWITESMHRSLLGLVGLVFLLVGCGGGGGGSSDNMTVVEEQDNLTTDQPVTEVEEPKADLDPDPDNGNITNWETIQFGSPLWDEGQSVVTDSQGHIYVSGFTYGEFEGTSHVGDYDLFLAKYSDVGELLWVEQLGTSAEEKIRGLVLDSTGNIYLTGHTKGSLGAANAGGTDMFLVKYNDSGVRQWTRQLGSSAADWGRDVVVDGAGNVYVTGVSSGDFDGNTSLGNQDYFLVKFNSNGNKQWSQLFGTISVDASYGITVDRNNAVYVTGATQDFLNGTYAGKSDIFLAKYSTNGDSEWTQLLGSTEDEYGYDVAADENGYLYITGTTAGDLDGGGSSGSSDIFLAKYNQSGTQLWVQQLRSPSNNYVNSIALDSLGNLYLAGWSQGELDGNASAGGYDPFVAKYGSNGTKEWLELFGSAADDYAYGITVDSNDQVLLTGWTEGELDGNPNLGKRDVFLVKYNSAGVRQ